MIYHVKTYGAINTHDSSRVKQPFRPFLAHLRCNSKRYSRSIAPKFFCPYFYPKVKWKVRSYIKLTIPIFFGPPCVEVKNISAFVDKCLLIYGIIYSK